MTLVRPGAYAVIRGPADRVLLVRERAWHLPGGGWEEGETMLQTLHREVFEETGCSITQARFHHRSSAPMETDDLGPIVKVWNVYVAEVTGTPAEGARWVEVADALEMLMQPEERDAVVRCGNSPTSD